MFREESEKASETLYVSAVPLSMVKDILKEKNLLNKGYDELWKIHKYAFVLTRNAYAFRFQFNIKVD